MESQEPLHVVFVHGILSSAATWGMMMALIQTDTDISPRVKLHGFEYSSPRLNLNPARRIPDLDDIADRFGVFLDVKLGGGSVLLVAHSQGGLVVQRYLVRRLSRGKGEQLARIRGILMYATPNTGSDFFLPLRKRLSLVVPNPQEQQLRPFVSAIEDCHRQFMESVVFAQGCGPSECRIPVEAYAGESDAIVKRASALSTIPEGGMLPGDHWAIIRPASAADERYLVLRRMIAAALDESATVPDPVLASVPEPAASAVQLTGEATEAVFPRAIRERYGVMLADVGLKVPAEWSYCALDQLRGEHLGHSGGYDAVSDQLDALCTALQAMPVLASLGWHEIGIRKLQHLYNRHVGGWPRYSTREDMLILAASAAIAEEQRALTDPGFQPERVTALARFMLGVAAHWKAPGLVTLDDDADLRTMANWLTRTLNQQWDDVAAYLDALMGGSTWALVELKAREGTSGARPWPYQIVIDLVRDHGQDRQTANFQFAATCEEDVRKALRRAMAVVTAEGDVCVDLILPRCWLDAGVEHWDVVDVGETYESIARHLDPRLRWAKHHTHALQRAQLQRQVKRMDWLSEPQAIPLAELGDQASFEGWVKEQDHPGVRLPPFFIGTTPRSCGHDPLGVMLRAGHGFLVWFSPDATDDLRHEAAGICTGMQRLQRRNDLPRVLADKLAGQYYPVIIWTDPDGRPGFDMPAARRGGTLRGGSQ